MLYQAPQPLMQYAMYAAGMKMTLGQSFLPGALENGDPSDREEVLEQTGCSFQVDKF